MRCTPTQLDPLPNCLSGTGRSALSTTTVALFKSSLYGLSQCSSSKAFAHVVKCAHQAAEILEKLGCKAEDCLMVGNDVSDDMVAEKLGMKVFLLTDCLINKENVDISIYPNGSFNQLIEYVKTLA